MTLDAPKKFFGFVFAKADNTRLMIQERDFRRGEGAMRRCHIRTIFRRVLNPNVYLNMGRKMSMRRNGELRQDIQHFGLSLSGKMRFSLAAAFVLCKSCETPFGHFSRTLPAFRLPLPPSASPSLSPSPFRTEESKGLGQILRKLA